MYQRLTHMHSLNFDDENYPSAAGDLFSSVSHYLKAIHTYQNLR